MGSLVYLRHGIENSPYRSLLETNQWAEICNIFTRDACALLGLSVESPLSVRLENHKPHTRPHPHCCSRFLSLCAFISAAVKVYQYCLCVSSFASGCMALPVLMNIKQVIEQRQCSGVWTHKDELPVSLILFFNKVSLFGLSQRSLNSHPVCSFRSKLTWGRSAGTTLCSPARFSGSRPQRATLL